MSTASHISASLDSMESFSNEFLEIEDWLATSKETKVSSLSSTSAENSRLNAEIHLAISTEPLTYISSLCDRLFTLYRDTQNRSFVLQFLPSFITTYYDVLYQQKVQATEDQKKDVRTTIDTFLLGLYNLSVFDENFGVKVNEFRIPNLTLPSIYHTPNADFYSPTPLTQHAISKHEKKSEFIHLQTFTPFDSVTATTSSSKLLNTAAGEQILWFLLIQYGMSVSTMDTHSCQAYIRMTTKLLGQGFSFNENERTVINGSSTNGRRIQVSSRIMTEILGTLFYFKLANSTSKETSDCMRLLRKRAEYELYADVILMTESMSSFHEFETQQSGCQDTIGIEVELPPTVDMVKQRRSATTARSIKNRQRTYKHHQTEIAIAENDLPNMTEEHETSVSVPSDSNPINVKALSIYENQSSPQSDHQNESTSESVRFIDGSPISSTKPAVDISSMDSKFPLKYARSLDMKTSSGSLIESSSLSPSPTSRREYKPISLASTQTYFETLQRQRASSPNSQQVQTILHHDPNMSLLRTSSMKHGDKTNVLATVRFVGTDENRTNVRETYL